MIIMIYFLMIQIDYKFYRIGSDFGLYYTFSPLQEFTVDFD